MNTPGIADGVMEMYVDGVMLYRQTSFKWRGVGGEDLPWNRWFGVYMFGGATAPFISPKHQDLYWNNLIFSKSSITF